MGEEKASSHSGSSHGRRVEKDNFLPCPECGLPCEITKQQHLVSEYYEGYLVQTLCVLGHKFYGDTEDVFKDIIKAWDAKVKEIPELD